MQAEQGATALYSDIADEESHDRTANALRVPSVLTCGLILFAVKAALKIYGFANTTAWIRRHVRDVPETSAAEPEVLGAAELAVAMAGALYPGRALCLEQSLVLYYLLRKQGAPVAFVMGVQAHPFLAHAWVEYRAEPLNDLAEHVKQFARLPDDPR